MWMKGSEVIMQPRAVAAWAQTLDAIQCLPWFIQTIPPPASTPSQMAVVPLPTGAANVVMSPVKTQNQAMALVKVHCADCTADGHRLLTPFVAWQYC
jgi:hypothetical protein